MYKQVYQIKRWTGKKTYHHKNYYVFDGLGLLFFDTIKEARDYVFLKSICLKNLFKRSKEIYKAINEYYIDKLINFRVSNHISREVTDILNDILECYKYMCKETYSEYMLGKLKYIYSAFLQISKILNMKILHRDIENTMNRFFTEYPVYNTANYKKNIEVKETMSVPLSLQA